MIRSVSVERTYNLGDYRSLKVTDKVDDIPEELAKSEEFMSSLRYLQLVELEKAYYQYALLGEGLKGKSTDGERFMTLLDISTNVYAKLLELYNNYKKEN